MPSSFFYILATLLLSLNFIRPLGLAISDWLYFGALFSAFFGTLISKKNLFSTWVPRNIFFWPALLITVGAVISLANSRNIPVAIVELFQQLYVITVFISLTWIMVKRGYIEKIVTFFIISGVITSFIADIDYFIGTNFGPILSGTPQIQLWGRFAGTLGHPNKLGYFLVLTIILTFYKLIIVKRNKKHFGLILIILIALLAQGLGIYLSGSITAYLGAFFGLVCLLYIIVPIRYRKVLAFLGVLLVIAVILVNMIWINSVYQPQVGIPDSSLIGIGINRVLNTTAGERIYYYKFAINSIAQSPIIGAGFDQLSTSGISQDERLLSGSIHNPFLQIWYAGGFIAFLGWLLLHIYIGRIAVVNLFLQNLSQNVLIKFLSAAVIAIIIMDQFQDSIYLREKWLIIGLLVSWTRMDKRLTK